MNSNRQLHVYTGPFGIGKSTLAWEFNRPSEHEGVYIQDSEGSGNTLYAMRTKLGKPPGRYVDLRNLQIDALPEQQDLLDLMNADRLPWLDSAQKDALVSYYKHLQADIAENLTAGKYHTFIIDTAEKLEAGITALVSGDKYKFGVTSEAYGGLWTRGVYPYYEQFFNSIWRRGVDTIILIFHLKTPWEGGRPVVGKVVMSGKKMLWKLSTFMVWLVPPMPPHSPNPTKAPSGLILKERLGVETVDDAADEWDTQGMLPPRIQTCTWREIRRYLEDGCDHSNLLEHEKMSDWERELSSPIISNKQMELMIADAEIELQKQRNAVAPTAASVLPSRKQSDSAALLAEKIKQLRLDKSDLQIREMLREEGMALPSIVRAFKVADGEG
jgi:hypothetical protein